MIAHGSPSCSAATSDRSRSSSAFSRSASTLIAMSPRNRSASASVNGIVVRLSQRDRVLQHLRWPRRTPPASSGTRRDRRAPGLRGPPRSPPDRPAPARARTDRPRIDSPCGVVPGARRSISWSTALSASLRSRGFRSSDASAASSRCSAANEGWFVVDQPIGDDRRGAAHAPASGGSRTPRRGASRGACASDGWSPPTRAPGSRRPRESVSSGPVLSGSISASSSSSNENRNTEARRASVRSRAGSASSRAVTTACTVGGRDPRIFGGAPSPSGNSIPVVSTMKNGLPPVRSAISVASSSVISPPPACRARSIASSDRERVHPQKHRVDGVRSPRRTLVEELRARERERQRVARAVASVARPCARPGRASSRSGCGCPRRPSPAVASTPWRRRAR